MTFKKRTKIEIDQALMSGDATGGYDFLPWLIYMRIGSVIGFVVNMFVGGACICYADDVISCVIGAFFGLTVPIIIMCMLVHEYTIKK